MYQYQGVNFSVYVPHAVIGGTITLRGITSFCWAKRSVIPRNPSIACAAFGSSALVGGSISLKYLAASWRNKALSLASAPSFVLRSVKWRSTSLCGSFPPCKDSNSVCCFVPLAVTISIVLSAGSETSCPAAGVKKSNAFHNFAESVVFVSRAAFLTASAKRVLRGQGLDIWP